MRIKRISLSNQKPHCANCGSELDRGEAEEVEGELYCVHCAEEIELDQVLEEEWLNEI